MPAGDLDLPLLLSAYWQGLFPMDDPAAQDEPLPFYRADPRAILDVDPDGMDRLRRRLRRSLARDPGWEPTIDRDFPAVVHACMWANRGRDGVWLTPRLARVYQRLHDEHAAHSFELWDGEHLIAGVLGVVIGRAAMLETMFHRIPHSGNVCLVRTLETLVSAGVELCDIQIITDHTRRLGAREIPAAEFEARLRRALT